MATISTTAISAVRCFDIPLGNIASIVTRRRRTHNANFLLPGEILNILRCLLRFVPTVSSLVRLDPAAAGYLFRHLDSRPARDLPEHHKTGECRMPRQLACSVVVSSTAGAPEIRTCRKQPVSSHLRDSSKD